jgi:hypothetical protein
MDYFLIWHKYLLNQIIKEKSLKFIIYEIKFTKNLFKWRKEKYVAFNLTNNFLTLHKFPIISKSVNLLLRKEFIGELIVFLLLSAVIFILKIGLIFIV